MIFNVFFFSLHSSNSRLIRNRTGEGKAGRSGADVLNHRVLQFVYLRWFIPFSHCLPAFFFICYFLSLFLPLIPSFSLHILVDLGYLILPSPSVISTHLSPTFAFFQSSFFLHHTLHFTALAYLLSFFFSFFFIASSYSPPFTLFHSLISFSLLIPLSFPSLFLPLSVTRNRICRSK